MLGPLGARRHIGTGLGFSAAPASASGTLAEQIIAVLDGVGWNASHVLLANDIDSLTFVGAKVSQWTNLGTAIGSDPVRATDSLRPTYDATGINGQPALFFTAQNLTTAASFNASAYPAGAFLVLGTNAKTTLASMVTFGSSASAGGTLGTRFNDPSTGRIGGQASGLNKCYSAPIYPLTSPGLVTITYDGAQSAGARTAVYLDNADVTDTRAESGPGGNLGSQLVQVGSGASSMIGFVGAAVFCQGTGPIPVAALQSAGTLLMNAWGI